MQENLKATISKETLSKYIAKVKEKKAIRLEVRANQELINPELPDEELEANCAKLEESRKKQNKAFAKEIELANQIANEASIVERFLVEYVVSGVINYADNVTNETIYQILSLLNIEVVE